ncbi:MAG: BrnT family toxin [Hyphomicrobiales bacterium]|nr:BrnT family toxin [Hyphomicrobiales bacterium]
MDEDFEWDYRKPTTNFAKHGVSFDAARGVFKDPFAVEWLDASEDYGEERLVIIGSVENRLITVAFTMRARAIRIISARLAERYERRRYYEENSS